MSKLRSKEAPISTNGQLGVRLAAETAKIRGGLPSGDIDLGLLDEIVAHLVSGQFLRDDSDD